MTDGYNQQLLEALNATREHLRRVFEEPIAGEPRPSAAIAFASLKKTATALDGIVLLAEKRLVAEVAAIGRIICEASLDAVWLLERDGCDLPSAEREANAQLLLDQAALAGTTLALRWIERGFGGDANRVDAMNTAAEIRARRGLEPKDKLDHPNLWERTKAAGDRFLENYDLYYRRMCLDAHNSVPGMVRSLQGLDGDELGLVLFSICKSLQLLLDATFQLLGRPDFEPINKLFATKLKLSDQSGENLKA